MRKHAERYKRTERQRTHGEWVLNNGGSRKPPPPVASIPAQSLLEDDAVPSKSPLVSAPAWWGRPSTERFKTPLVNWPAVVAAVAVAFAVVIGALGWIATHPGKALQPSEPMPVLILHAPVSGAVALPSAPPPPLATIPAVHRPHREDVLVNHIPRDDEAPPLLPPVLEPKCEKPPAAEAPLAGEMYGTQVLFLNNPAAAEAMAKREKKLLFVMHISGNFEDSCFT